MSVWKIALGVFLGLALSGLVSSVISFFFLTAYLDHVVQTEKEMMKRMTTLFKPPSFTAPARSVPVRSRSAPTIIPLDESWRSAPARPVQRWVPGRSLADCIKPNKLIDDEVLRCRRGYYEWVR
jgi:hypothetical protein